MSLDDVLAVPPPVAGPAPPAPQRFRHALPDADDLARRDSTEERLRATLVVNPHAAGVHGAIGRIVCTALADRFDVQAIETRAPGHARELAAAAAEEGRDVVIALGGDGTVNDVANGLAGSQTALACLPGGSANVFVKILGIPSDLVDATAHMLSLADDWRWREVRLGTVDGRLFTFASGLGLDASVTRYVDARPRLKARYGPWFFAWGASVAFTREYLRRPPRLEACLDGRGLAGVTALVQNASPYTYFHDRPIEMAAGAELAAAGLSGCVLARANAFDVPSIALRAVTGRARVVDHRQVHGFGPTQAVEIHSADGRPLPLQADGDFLGLVEGARFGVSEHPLRVTS